MSLAQFVQGRRVDSSIDLAHFAGCPIYYFDLGPVLAGVRSAHLRDPARLRDVCEQHLSALAASEVLMFSGTGFYLIVQSCSGIAAAALANRINLALLKLFFGTESMVPEQLAAMFRSVSPDVAAVVMHTDADDGPGDGYEDHAASEVPSTLSPEKRFAVVQLAAHGRLPQQNLELRFVPVHDLQRRRVTTFFCTPVSSTQSLSRTYGHAAFQNMNRHDWPFVDRAMLSYAIKFARWLAAGGIVAAIGTSVNFETLAWSNGRKIYCQALRAIGVSDIPFLILKIENVPAGILPSRLAEIVSAVRPQVKRVFVHLSDCETPTQQCGRLGASGLVLSLPPRPAPSEVVGAATWLVRACAAQNALSCIERIDSAAALEMVGLAGVRFGLGSAFGAEAFPGDTEPAAIEAFMEKAAGAPDRRVAVRSPQIGAR